MGDSGAPLWTKDDVVGSSTFGQNVVVGVLHGGTSAVPGVERVCGTMEESATKLNDEILKWIKWIL